jgi:periplasmic divalent cation tolerance protein
MEVLQAYITTANREEALRIGKALVASRLAACVNVLEGMHSVYWWEGRMEEAHECVLLAKTCRDKSDEMISMVKEMHSYACPCVVFLPITGGSPDYLAWIRKETGHA